MPMRRRECLKQTAAGTAVMLGCLPAKLLIRDQKQLKCLTVAQ